VTKGNTTVYKSSRVNEVVVSRKNKHRIHAHKNYTLSWPIEIILKSTIHNCEKENLVLLGGLLGLRLQESDVREFHEQIQI
jgi:hypothetical protein